MDAERLRRDAAADRKARATLVGWMRELCEEFGLSTFVFHAAVGMLDRLMAAVAVPLPKLQCAGAVAVLSSSRLHQPSYAPSLDEISEVCCGAAPVPLIGEIEELMISAVGRGFDDFVCRRAVDDAMAGALGDISLPPFGGAADFFRQPTASLASFKEIVDYLCDVAIVDICGDGNDARHVSEAVARVALDVMAKISASASTEHRTGDAALIFSTRAAIVQGRPAGGGNPQAEPSRQTDSLSRRLAAAALSFPVRHGGSFLYELHKPAADMLPAISAEGDRHGSVARA